MRRPTGHIGAITYWEKHHLTVEEAEEALADPNRLVFDPDPRRNPGGKGVRIIGYSHTAQAVLAGHSGQ